MGKFTENLFRRNRENMKNNKITKRQLRTLQWKNEQLQKAEREYVKELLNKKREKSSNNKQDKLEEGKSNGN